MFKLYIQALFLGHTCHVHQARTIRARHKFGARLNVSFYLVLTHLGTDRSLFHGEHTAKATAFVRTLRFNDLNAIHERQQIFDLIKLVHMLFAGSTQPQLTDTVAGVVQTHLMREGT